MKILSLEQLLQLHALVVQATGGAIALRDLGRIESVIATQTQNIFDEELFPTITEKAAAIIRGIIADHPFVDGNKRTAMLAGITLLSLNGLVFKANPTEIENFAVIIATDKLDVITISDWLSAHIH